MILLTKLLFAGLLFCSSCGSVDTPFNFSLIILLTAEQSFELSFTVHVHYFPSCGDLCFNLVPFCFIEKN